MANSLASTDPTQASNINNLVNNFTKADTNGDGNLSMQALHAAIAKPGTTRANVDALIGEVNGLKGQMFSQRIDDLFAMKEILTPEQFVKMQEKHKGWMDKKHEGPEKKNSGPDQG